MWFRAHAVFYYRLDAKASYLIHENVYLEAMSVFYRE